MKKHPYDPIKDEKVCSKCLAPKRGEAFYTTTSGRPRQPCKACVRTLSREYQISPQGRAVHIKAKARYNSKMAATAKPSIEDQICRLCNIKQPISEFHRRASEKTGYDKRCKGCLRAYARSIRQMPKHQATIKRARTRYRQSGKGKLKDFAYLLKSKFGLTVDQFNELLEKQNGRCAICEHEPTANKRLSVDHCHRTGRVRGLLCVTCNSAIARFEKDERFLIKAAQYLGYLIEL